MFCTVQILSGTCVYSRALHWVGTCHAMDGHRLLLMVMVLVWVQIQRKMLGSSLQSGLEHSVPMILDLY